MFIKEPFKSTIEEPIIFEFIAIDEASITNKSDQSKIANYEISKKIENLNTEKDTSNSNSKFNIDNYSVNNSGITHSDKGSKTIVNIFEPDHSAKGTF